MSDTKTYCPHGCHRGRVIDLAGGLTPEGEPVTKPCPECEGTGFVEVMVDPLQYPESLHESYT